MKNVAIREHHLYNKAFTRGKKYVGRYVAVYVLRDYAAERLKKENPLKLYVNRLGLSVSKKLGGAVKRNRAKRILRAGYDAVRGELRTGYLIVISPRLSVLSAKSTDVAKDLSIAFCELGMISSGETKQQ